MAELDNLVARPFDLGSGTKRRQFHQGPPEAHLMLPGHANLAKQMIRDGVDQANLINARYRAFTAIQANPGLRKTIPTPPINTGYVTVMKRRNLDSSPLKFD